MQFLLLIFTICALSCLVSVTGACKGCINLDEYNFDKIIYRFNAVLVKFDVAYPYGEKHDVFGSLAGDIVDNNDIILAEVGIKDYGEKDNEQLAQKYEIKGKDDLPAIRLFVKGHDSPIAFQKNADWTVDSLKQFIRDNSAIYIGLPGCLQQFDQLAMKFTNSDEKERIYKETEGESSKLTNEKEKGIASTYLKFMSKVLDNGVQFVKQEVSRLSKIVSGAKVNEKKKLELAHRLNILKSFVPAKTEL